MDTVLVSPQFQIIIPRNIRESLGLQPGQRVQVIEYDNRIEVIPIRPVTQARGFLHGIDTTIEREQDRV